MIRKKIKDILLEVGNWMPPNIEIKDSMFIQEDLGFDSLSLIKLQLAIEDTFNVFFDPLETDFVSVFSTVKSLSNYVKKMQGK